MTKKSLKTELVAPAGDWPSLMAAVENGADSVYFGLKGLNMRNLAVNFDIMELSKVMKYLHNNKKKGYLALNVIVLDHELAKVEKILRPAKKAKVDAIILWDTAVLSIAKKLGLRIHLSTQASVANKEAVSFYARLGAKRIVLARECSIKDIKQITTHIKKKRLGCEIETFVHGAMCVSISGRCFLSEFSFKKSANKGECLQPCRREYVITDVDDDASYRLGKDYVLSPKDLCAIDYIDDLVKAGAKAFKIEGRMKSALYVKVVTSAYRRAIDAAQAGKLTTALKRKLKTELKTVYNRGFSDGFLFGEPVGAQTKGIERSRDKIFIGEVTKFFKKINVAQIKIMEHSLKCGDEVIFLGKKTPALTTKITQIEYEHNVRKRAIRGEEVGVKLPFIVKPKDKVFIWSKI